MYLNFALEGSFQSFVLSCAAKYIFFLHSILTGRELLNEVKVSPGHKEKKEKKNFDPFVRKDFSSRQQCENRIIPPYIIRISPSSQVEKKSACTERAEISRNVGSAARVRSFA